ncbi:MAG: asparagine--tRNA ligase [archaeon]
MYISIEKAIKKGKGKVSLRGWVYRERGSSKIKFVVLRDSSNIIQCVIEKDKISEKEWQDAKKLLIESSVEIEGTIKKDERAPTGYEINVSKLNVVHFAEKYPITKDQSEEFLLDVRHLAIRSRKLTSSLKIRSTVMGALHECLRKKGYIEAEAPSFNAATSEGGAEVFKLDYFGRKVFLTQSWQFYAENFIYAFEKVYAMAPSFRAEKSRTNRHLTEFWHCEVEAAWENMDYIIKVAEDCIMYSIKEVLKNNKTELNVLGVEESHLKNIKIPFPRITYKEAIEILNKKDYKIKYGEDFGVNEEREIASYYNNFVVVTNYPLELLKFYHGEDPKNPGTGTNFNLMAPGIGETVDGSQREPDLNKIVERLKKANIDLGDSNWYLDSRRYGAVPHSGFGLGTERLVQWICKLDTIKDAIPFPRTPTRVYP